MAKRDRLGIFECGEIGSGRNKVHCKGYMIEGREIAEEKWTDKKRGRTNA